MTERLARACSRHPWRTIGAWIGTLVLALAAIALLLPGNLTSNGGAAASKQPKTMGPQVATRIGSRLIVVKSQLNSCRSGTPISRPSVP